MSAATFASTAEPRFRLLIVSVGSLVGQNILDSLEFPAFSRRHLVRVFGTNSVAASASNFRCDECFLVPETASPDHPERMRRVLREVQPDLVLSARDADTAAIWKLLEADESLPGRVPYGNLRTIRSALNKWECSRFCERHGLPFAETLALGASADERSLRDFTDKVGFPLIAKPAEGFASKGVFFVRNWAEVLLFMRKEDYILQEYLGEPGAMEEYFALLDGPKPLFTEAPGVSHHTCHVPISSRREIGEIFVLRNHHNFGAVTRLRRVAHAELEALARRFAEALIAEGGFGPLSVQFRSDRNGVFKAQEMNLRTTGSTFPRLMMGQDEIGYIVRDLLPHIDFPVYARLGPAYDEVITKSLCSYAMKTSEVENLSACGHWRF